MKVVLLAHTQLSEDFYDSFDEYNEFLEYDGNKIDKFNATDGQAVALTAIRTCYSANKPSEILEKEGERYFGRKATDGQGGTDADRLFRQIVSSKHTSTLEHLSFTFAIEGISRSCLAQLTRHRIGFSYSVQSQRYVRFGSDDKIGGFDYVVPSSVDDDKICVNGDDHDLTANDIFVEFMKEAQETYDLLRKAGVPPEDARMVLPNAVATNLVMTANLRALLDFYSKRREGRGAQAEIAELAEKLRKAVVAVEPWTEPFFEQA